MVCLEAIVVVVPVLRCPPAESTWLGLHFVALHSHSEAPPETHRAAGGERKQHEARTPQTSGINTLRFTLIESKLTIVKNV